MAALRQQQQFSISNAKVSSATLHFALLIALSKIFTTILLPLFQAEVDAMSVDADYIRHIQKNGTGVGLEGMELTGSTYKLLQISMLVREF